MGKQHDNSVYQGLATHGLQARSACVALAAFGDSCFPLPLNGNVLAVEVLLVSLLGNTEVVDGC